MRKYTPPAAVGVPRRMAWLLSATLLAIGFTAPPAMAADTTATEIANLFNSDFGDEYTSMFLNQLFGPLFPAVDGTTTDTVFSQIIGIFNTISMVIAGLLFFHNGVVGVLQSANEGVLLGRRWSSLWAPIRVLFAVALMVPLPDLGGYNVAQAGVAYLVKGATRIASLMWRESATMVVQGTEAISVSAAHIDPSVITTLYENAACRAVVNYQYQLVNGSTTIGVVELPLSAWVTPGGVEVSTGADDGRITAIRDANSEYQQMKICGYYTVPELPLFIDQIEEGVVSTMTDATKASLAADYNQAYVTALDTLMNGVGTIKGLNDLTSESMAAVVSNGESLPNYNAEIVALYNRVNQDLNDDLDALLDDAVGVDRKGQAARDALLARIQGDPNCDATATSSTDYDHGMCYGEGWMGAGSWYMTMAHLSNEVASLVAGQPTAGSGSYTTTLGPSANNLFVANGGREPIWPFGNKDKNAENAGFSSKEEAEHWMARHMQIYHTSTAGLAALGFPMSNAALTEMNQTTAATGFLSEWEGYNRFRDNMFDLLLTITSPSGNMTDDPMIGLVKLGNAILVGAGILSVGAIAAGFVTGGASGALMGPLIALMMTAGATLAFILPLMPFIFWILAVTGYFLLIVEAVVAVNLWALAHMRLDGEGVSGDAGRNGWLMLLSLVMTPPLMILGYLVGMILFRVSSSLIDIGIHQAASGIFNGNPFSDLVAIIAFGILICVIYVALLERSFSLVSEFPGRALRWMGADAHLTNGEENKVRVAAGASIAGVHQSGGKLTAAAGGVAQRVGLGENGKGYDAYGNKRAGSLRQAWDTRNSGVSADKGKSDKSDDPRETPTDDTGGTSG